MKGTYERSIGKFESINTREADEFGAMAGEPCA